MDSKKEKAVLIAVRFPDRPLEDAELSLAELGELAETAGARVLDSLIQNRREPDTKYFIGKGKVEEIRSFYHDADKPDVVIFNHELTPTQARNLETELGCKVITRTELILDIFALHARTKTAKLQVELAQLQYELPRITGKGTEMSRLGGGIGTRGPGEQQLELDRRLIQKKIHVIREKMKEIESENEVRRKNRGQREFKIGVIGYTNAGKSTLLNRLTRSEVLAEDKLFATLDTTTRRLWLGNGEDGKPQYAVLTDTVGFIRDIPHGLVESFRSTLADTVNSDLLLHVLDISSRDHEEKKNVVDSTLQEIGASGIPVLLCLNKIDRISEEELLEKRMLYPEAVFISAAEGLHLEPLKKMIREQYLKSKIFLQKRL